jgi:hypothetical protein
MSASRSSRIALWAAVFALLFKAAVPMFASQAAQWQGKSVAEVCTVYGVATVALVDDSGSRRNAPGDRDSAPSGAHQGDTCALNALAAAAEPTPHTSVFAAAAQAGAHDAALPRTRPRDACTAWLARLKHGPPARA